MKQMLFALELAVLFCLISCKGPEQAIRKDKETMSMGSQIAVFIPHQAVEGKAEDLSRFLTGGARIVQETEPDTWLWFALAKESDAYSFAIIDFFPHDAGVKAHFDGKVAAALKSNSKELVHEGWDKGVVGNVHKARVLGQVVRPHAKDNAHLANFIKIKAAAGKEKDLEQLLTAGAGLVNANEPNTLVWFALKIDNNTFAIFDVFSHQKGRKEHFEGQVAALLKEKSAFLVDGGWEKGVLPNVINYKILSSVIR